MYCSNYSCKNSLMIRSSCLNRQQSPQERIKNICNNNWHCFFWSFLNVMNVIFGCITLNEPEQFSVTMFLKLRNDTPFFHCNFPWTASPFRFLDKNTHNATGDNSTVPLHRDSFLFSSLWCSMFLDERSMCCTSDHHKNNDTLKSPVVKRP